MMARRTSFLLLCWGHRGGQDAAASWNSSATKQSRAGAGPVIPHYLAASQSGLAKADDHGGDGDDP